jgi:DNA modification methylase
VSTSGSSVRLEWEGKRPPSPPSARLERTAEVLRPSGTSLEAEPNRILLGDNLHAMAALLPEWEGRLRLIYADPPFGTGKGFQRRVGSGEDSRKPDKWRMADGYSDAWEGPDQYLEHLYPRLALMHRLLAEDGSLYLHLDWRAVHHARLLLDEIFGPEQILNEIIWVYHGPSPVKTYFNRKHDTLLAYRKGRHHVFNADQVRIPYDDSTRRTFASSPRAGFGRQPDLARGKVPEDWWYFPVVARLHTERTGYPTQKPEALLERILLASSEPGDWVGDFYCGSGTTLRVAETNGRRWIGADLSPHAVQVCLRRLALAQSRGFAVESALEERSPERPDAHAIPASGSLHVHTQVCGREVRLQLEAMSPCEPQEFPVSLDYWEVDFDFQPPIFRSTAQAARPWRRGLAPLSLSHRYAQPGRFCARVRAISASGEEAETQLSIVV